MQKVTVEVKSDHLESLAKLRKPVVGIAELIWNGFDADAELVEVTIKRNPIEGLDHILVKDDGHGLAHDEALDVFKGLGGSWKRRSNKTKGIGRFLHGKKGRGRFRAFGLGGYVEWVSHYAVNGSVRTCRIEGTRADLGTFMVHSPAECEGNTRTGTSVKITEIASNFRSLNADHATPFLTEEFAMYLMTYPGLTLLYDGVRIEPKALQSRKSDYEFTIVGEGDEVHEATLTVVEWRSSIGQRTLFICDENGFALDECAPGVQAPGFFFSAYLKCEHFRDLETDGTVLIEELHPFRDEAVRKAKKQLRSHFRQRRAEETQFVVDEWKKQRIYPFEGNPENIIEESERQVFDIVALNLSEYSPTFATTDPKDQRVTFKLLRHAVESSPSLVRKILTELLDLPIAKQEELAKLLERTSLEAMITAAKVVADRLDFLRGLEVLVFDPQSKKELLERSQLHRIVAGETWIFGEEYHLTVDDENLREVLNKHLKKIGGAEEVDLLEPVQREDGREGIVDLVLSRTVPLPSSSRHQNIVIELKRPRAKIGETEIGQINSYALAVSNDERFDKQMTEWVFIAVSDDLTESAVKMANQGDRPVGQVYRYDNGTVWVKSWSQIINDARSRLSFFQKHLECKVDRGSALEFLDETYAKYLPDSVKEKVEAEKEDKGLS